jgi:branched-chain amino acid transport system substrate-binding protein
MTMKTLLNVSFTFSIRSSTAAAALLFATAAHSQAQAPLKVGLMLPATGTFASLGNNIESGFKLFVQEQGGKLGGRA